MKTLISFPRSGAHWLMTLVDMSVNHKVEWQHLHDIRFNNHWEIPKVADFKDGFKPILTPHYLDIARRPRLVCGGHDYRGKLRFTNKIDKFVFLYRKDVPSVVYSYLKWLQCSMTKENILRMVIAYYDYMKEWKAFISKNKYPSIVITYEDLIRETRETLDRVLEFYDFDKDLIKRPDVKKVDKKQVFDHVDQFHTSLLYKLDDKNSLIVDCSEDYSTQREEFFQQFGSFIDCLSQNRNSLPSIFKLGSTKTIEYDYEKCS